MVYLDLALRGGAITLLLMLAVLLWRAPIGWEGRLSVATLSVTKTGFLLTTAAVPLDFPAAVAGNLFLLGSLVPLAITWLIVSIFLDTPGQRWPWIAAGAGTSAAHFLSGTVPGATSVCLFMGVALFGGLVLLALWTARDDVVECRCRARPAFAGAIAGMALLLTGTQAIGLVGEGTMVMALMRSGGTLIVTVAFAIWLLHPNMQLWPGQTEPAPEPAAPESDDAVEAALIARIRSAMAAGIWREEGLTIGALAVKLSVPEHRLRRAINRGLGYRNFSSFINGARIEAAAEILSDPVQMNRTVLEIAYDVGFASVGPFNRAFRAALGVSPTEYRQQALAGAIADSERSSPIPANLH